MAEFEKKKQISITAMPKKVKEKNLTNRSINRLEKKHIIPCDFKDRKGSPMHERIIKEGAVLHRKTSVNPMKGMINPLQSHVIDARLSSSLEKKNNSERTKGVQFNGLG